MRPPEFTGGNPRRASARGRRSGSCFNEAAGIHRRKLSEVVHEPRPRVLASMRPPEFTGGNLGTERNQREKTEASMRPPEFTGGNTLNMAKVRTT